MRGQLSDKVALVCNVSSSLGYAIAKKLGNAGARLFVCDPDSKSLNYVIDGLKSAEISATKIVTDLTISGERQKLFEEIKKKTGLLDIAVINQKPNLIKGSIINNTESDFNQMFFKYLTVPFLTCQNLLPLFEKTNKSSIILMSSFTSFTPFIDIGLYSATQTGVLGLCKVLAQNLASKKIRVNSVCLGMFDDDGAGAMWSSCSGAATNSKLTNKEAETLRNNLSNYIPLGRTGNCEDAVGLIEFLASDQSNYITGENFTVSGGVSVRL